MNITYARVSVRVCACVRLGVVFIVSKVIIVFYKCFLLLMGQYSMVNG